MNNKLFGTDGIRGVANVYPMTSEIVLKVGRAAGSVFQREDRPHTILIGKDTRRSGYMFENALTAGLCSVGVNVLLVGPLPTPGVSYIMRSLRADGAIMISASHNPYHDNGIKFFGRDGYKIPDDTAGEIARLVLAEEDGIHVSADLIGTARRIDDAVGRYVEFVKASFPKRMRLDGIKIVCDCANGAAYKVGPYTLRELGAEVVAIGDRPDGQNINLGYGSEHPQEMRATVIRERADLGIAFDGDGDRIVMADEHGRMLDGNAILAMLGIDLLERDALPGHTVVTNIVANAGLERALEPYGGKVLRVQVGDRFVVEAMRERNLVLGGESSGHVVMLEHNTTGDAVIAGLNVLAAMLRKDQPMSLIASVYQPLPEAHVQIALNGRPVPPPDCIDEVVHEFDHEIDGAGMAIVRPSGTEPIIRVMIQHEALRTAEALVQRLAERLERLLGP